MKLLLIIILIGSFNSTNSAPFPAEKFFNATKETDADRALYLCQVNENVQKKCCSCDKATCFQDCCIDTFWDSDFYVEDDLDFYLETFVNIYKMRDSVNSCHPIFDDYDRSDFHVEMISVESSIRVDRRHAADCQNTYLNETLMPVVYSETKGFYLNEKCAEENGILNTEPLNISVGCQSVRNLKNGIIFNRKSQKHFINCDFYIDKKENNIDLGIRKCQKKYIDSCAESDRNYHLCKMYFAPTAGYKNKHCLKCNKEITQYSEKLDISSCFLIVNHTYPYMFTLKLNKYNNFILTSARQKFPVKTFFKNASLRNSKLEAYNLCEQQHDLVQCNCYCEESCFFYKKCCIDVLWEESNPIDLSSYTRLLIEKQKLAKVYECKMIFPSLNNSFNGQYYMVSSCSAFGYGYDESQCYNEIEPSFRLNTPVIGNDGNIYRNLYCARCNNVYQYKPLNIILRCKRQQNTSISRRDCSYDIFRLDVIHNSLLSCKYAKYTIKRKRCKDKDHPFFDLCHSYEFPYGNYKNPHCYLCSSKKEFEDVKCYQSRYKYLSWSLMISFSDVETRVTSGSYSTSFQTAPPDFKICFDGNKFTVSEMNCQNHPKNGINTTSPSFVNCLALQKPSLFLIQGIKTRFGFFNWKEYLSNLGITDYKRKEYHRSQDGTIDHIVRNLSYDQTIDLMSYHNKIQADLGENVFVLSTVDQPVLSKIHSFKHTFPLGRICYEPVMLYQSAIKFLSSCGLLYNGTLYNASEIILLSQMSGKNLTNDVVICKRFHMYRDTCHPYFVEGEVEIKHDGSFVHSRNDEQRIFQVENYIPTRNGVAICSKDNFKENPDMLYKIETILSLVGCSISILCYIIVLVTYCVFTTLQNTPGKNTMSLTLSLLIGDTMYLLAAIYDITGPHRFLFFCKTIAILMHFSLVNGYIWCITISYDLMMTFSGTVALSKAGNYSTYWWLTTLCSLAIIILAIILDSMNIIKTGYGDNGICLPYKHVGRLLFYVSPIAISIILSFGFLIKTIFSMSRQNRNCKRLKHRNSKSANITLVALKLCFVLGIPELIGLFQIISTQKSTKEHQFNKVIGFIYTITRSFRGIFICFVYILQERVLNLYKMSIFRLFSTSDSVDNENNRKKVSKSTPSNSYHIDTQL